MYRCIQQGNTNLYSVSSILTLKSLLGAVIHHTLITNEWTPSIIDRFRERIRRAHQDMTPSIHLTLSNQPQVCRNNDVNATMPSENRNNSNS